MTILRDPISGKVKRRGGKVRRGSPGDPCCCGETPPTDPTFPCECGSDFICNIHSGPLNVQSWSYTMFATNGAAWHPAAADDAYGAQAQGFFSRGESAPDKCYEFTSGLFCGMNIGSKTGLYRRSTAGACTNKYWVMEFWADNADFSGQILIWRGAQQVANVTPLGATFVQVGGSSGGPASIDLFCQPACLADGSACGNPSTVTFTGGDPMLLMPSAGGIFTLRRLAPTGTIWSSDADGDQPAGRVELACDSAGNWDLIIGTAIIAGAPTAPNNSGFRLAVPGGPNCPPTGVYDPTDLVATTYAAVLS